MNKASLLFLFLMVFVQGCGLIGENNQTIASVKRYNQIVVAQQLQKGLSEVETRDLFAARTLSVSTWGFMRPEIAVSNPYKTEIVFCKGGEAKVLWYYTQMVKNDSKITQDELTPVLLMDDKVVGWGNNFLTDYCRYKN